MPAATTAWGHDIAVETIGGVPFRRYTQRPKHITEALALGARWGARTHIAQGERTLSFQDLLAASASAASK